jgi:uncharacterized membrane protein
MAAAQRCTMKVMAKRKAKRAKHSQPADPAAAASGAAAAHAAGEGRRGKGGSGRTPVLRKRHVPNWPVLALALLGMALTGYLSATSWLKTPLAYCAEGSSCDLVQTSRWGNFLGLPTAFWGFLGYAALGHIAFRVRNAELHWKGSWMIALTGLAVSVYLTGISLYVIHATCFYCLTSLGLMAALFVVITLQRPQGLPSFSWPLWAGQTALLAVVVVVALHLHYSGVFNAAAGPEDPYLQGLAEHLKESGATFYGAYW